MADYRINVRNKDTGEVHRVSDFDWLECVSVVNGVGILQWQYSGDKAIQDWIKNLPDKSTMELWRRDRVWGVDWYRYWSGIVRDREFEQKQIGSNVFTAYHDNIWLSHRIVNYPAGVTNRSQFLTVAPETIAKTIVEYNLGASATTANGRKRTATIAGISNATDQSRGTATDWYCFGDNVLKTLQELALESHFDFNINKTSETTWQFEYYPDWFGTDRRDTVIVGLMRGNLESATYSLLKSQEKTVACVWGSGEGADRDYATVLGPTYAVDNDIEVYVDARNVELGDASALTAKGSSRINESIYVEALDVEITQTPSSQYQKDYFLGDVISVVNPANGLTYIRKIQGVTINLSKNGNEKIDIELAIPVGEA